MQDSQGLPLYKLDDKSLTGKWCSPQKRIYSGADIPAFHKSKAIVNINEMISLICTKISLTDVPPGALNDQLVDFDNNSTHKNQTATVITNKTSIVSPPTFEKELKSDEFAEITKSILEILEAFEKLKEETPPFPGPRRYGNLACRDWHDKLTSNVDSIIDNAFKNVLTTDIKDGPNYAGFKAEIKYYLLGSFGSRERLDFGTGHELSFVSFLGCLLMSDLIKRDDTKGCEWLLVLSKYYDLVKSLILSYTLEPAGSHGVWGLDDHFHLVYVFGSCQLVDFKELGSSTEFKMSESRSKVLNYRMGLTPSSVLNVDILRRERCKNLYYNAISFIKMVKVGPFSEHSPILYEISASKNWEKVARGMLKMYYGEVLSKFPVVQHFYFGGVFFPWTDLQGNKLPSSEGQTETVIEAKQKEAKGETSTRYSEEVNNTMGMFYPTREGELSKLLQERRTIGVTGRRGKELPSSRALGTTGITGIPNTSTTHHPSKTSNSDTLRRDIPSQTHSAGGMPMTQAPWKR